MALQFLRSLTAAEENSDPVKEVIYRQVSAANWSLVTTLQCAMLTRVRASGNFSIWNLRCSCPGCCAPMPHPGKLEAPW